MTKPYAITDDSLLAAWGGADGMDAERRAETAGRLRALVESDSEGVCEVERFHRLECYTADVTALRTALGGWDAVWRAVLEDEGFEERRRGECSWWEAKVARSSCEVSVNGAKGVLYFGEFDAIPLRSPADLRVRVGHARGLFGE